MQHMKPNAQYQNGWGEMAMCQYKPSPKLIGEHPNTSQPFDECQMRTAGVQGIDPLVTDRLGRTRWEDTLVRDTLGTWGDILEKTPLT